MSRLAGRKIFITGAASGIGLATVDLFVKEGARIAAVDRNAAGLTALVDKYGKSVTTYALDLADLGAVAAAVRVAAAELEGLDGIVNCAGIDSYAPIEEVDAEAFRHVLDVNVTSCYVICREALPFLRASCDATVVNVSSGSGLKPMAGRIAYSVSKAAQVMLSKSLAMEAAPEVRVNALCPGIVDTPLFRQSYENAESPDAALQAILGPRLIKRAATPVELADAILFLSTSQSSYMTGSTLSVDGGRIFH